MRGGRRGGSGDNFFDPFAGFSGFGGFSGHRSLMSNFFGGRDPFDDPFFTSPFGGAPFGSMFQQPTFFGPGGNPFMNAPAGFLEHQHPMPHVHPHTPQSNIQRGPIIEELDSDDEKAENEGQRRDNPGKHSRSGTQPFIEYPDDNVEDRRGRQIQLRNEYNRMNTMPSQPQSQSFSFHSSTVSYGGGNGAYYTKSSTRRAGSDGVAFEEHKEADSTTGRAFHQVSRGLHNKGHTLTRNLKSDGRVDNMQTLHNLNEDELPGFEQAWKGKAQKHLPGVSERFNGFSNNGAIGGGQDGHASRGGWALPSTEHPQRQQHPNPKRVRINPGPASNPAASQSHNSGRRMFENGR